MGNSGVAKIGKYKRLVWEKRKSGGAVTPPAPPPPLAPSIVYLINIWVKMYVITLWLPLLYFQLYDVSSIHTFCPITSFAFASVCCWFTIFDTTN